MTLSKPRANVALLNGSVMPENFDTFQEAVDEARTKNRALVLSPQTTYTLDAAITGAEVTIIGNGATIDISGLASNALGITAAGTNSTTGIALSSDASVLDTSILVASAGTIAAGSWLFIRSSRVFEPTSGGTYGEWVRCLSIVGTTVTLYAPLAYDYDVADTAVVDVIEPIGNFTWSDFKIVGSGAGTQRGAFIDRAVGIQLRNVSTDLCNNNGIGIRRCFGVDISGGSFDRANLAGYSYGIVVYDGCAGVTIAGVTGFDTRHVVTVGGTGGVNRGIIVQHGKAFAARDAGFDCHGTCDGVLFANLYVEGGSTSVDGIVMQGLNCTARDIEVRAIQRYGVLMQNLPTATSYATRVSGVRGAADTAVVLVDVYGGNITSLQIDNVVGNGDYLVRVIAKAGNTIARAVTRGVAGSSTLTSRGVQYYANGAGAIINSGGINDCDLALTGGALEAVYLLTDGGGIVDNVVVESIRAEGGTYGLRMDGATNCVVEANNSFSGQSIGPVGWGAGAGNRGYRYSGSATYNPANLVDGDGATTTVTVTGAVLGDAVTELSFDLDLQGITLTGWVSAADTVSVRFQNETGIAVNLSSGTLRAATTRMTT